jgi:phospholipid N-methyltransferase
MNLFLRQAISNFRQTGALFKSSTFLSKKITSLIPKTPTNQLIIELGPGNGAITKEILNTISEDSELIVFELNSFFCSELAKINDKRLTIINVSATGMKHLDASKKATCVISSLPLASIPKTIKKNVFQESKNILAENGVILQYQYSLLDYSFLKQMFTNVKIKFTFLNLPPSFIYVCRK